MGGIPGSMQVSRFLRKVMQEGILMRREEWASLLGVEPAFIDAWCAGLLLPGSGHFAKLYDTLVTSEPDDILLDACADLDLLLTTRLEDALSPRLMASHEAEFRIRAERTVADYILRPSVDALVQVARTLPYGQQRELLLALHDTARATTVPITGQH